MLGRRLDRYVTVFFLWHFVLCTVAILGLYVIVDTFTHLDDFVQHEGVAQQIRWIATYHLYQVPALLSQFLPIVTLLAGIIALARLARYNELSAMKAAGVSIHRTLLPVFLAALVIGSLGAANQELFVPRLEGDIRSARLSALGADDEYKELFVFDESKRTGVWVRRLLNGAQGFELRRLEAAPRQPAKPDDKDVAATLESARAVWVADWLYLFDGRTVAPEGGAAPFARKALRAGVPANRFQPPDEPPTRLADGTPAFLIPASLDGRTYDLRFATLDPLASLRFIRGGQVTRVYEGERTAPPIAVHSALWDAQQRRWLAHAQTYVQLSPEKRRLKVFDADPLEIPPPQELIHSRTDFALKSFAQLRHQLQRPACHSPAVRQRILVELHSRLASPLASFVLLLIAIPFLFQQEGGKSTWIGVGLSLFVTMGFYFVSYAFQVFGRHPDGLFGGMPWLAAWLPTFLFGLAGAALLHNMDT